MIDQKSNRKPNILFLMADHYRWDALGCENPYIKTPNLDQLAKEGVRFRQAVCNSPMCVSSRHSMMFGLYPSQSGIRHNTQICPNDQELPLPVLPQRLTSAGYQTAGFGKTHWYAGLKDLKGVDKKKSKRGFEYRATAYEGEPGSISWAENEPENYRKLENEVFSYGQSLDGYLGCTSEISVENHREGWLTRQAIKFLDNERDNRRPFFLYLSFDFPHPGFNVPAAFENLYSIDEIPDCSIYEKENVDEHYNSHPQLRDGFKNKTSEERKMTKLRYYALCSYVDHLYGRIISKLKEQDELKNTFIIFTSDHGYLLNKLG